MNVQELSPNIHNIPFEIKAKLEYSNDCIIGEYNFSGLYLDMLNVTSGMSSLSFNDEIIPSAVK